MSQILSDPRVKVWLFCLIFLPITLNLGFWQLERAEEKQAYLSGIEAKHQKEMVVWQSVMGAESVLFEPLELVGHYQDNSFLLDNRVKNGRPGYDVLTVFRLFTGELLLVNRGWISAGKYRENLPVIEQPKQLVTVKGHFYRAQGDVPVLKEVALDASWPKRIQQIRWPVIESALGEALTERVEFRLASNEEPGAYQVGWPTATVMPEKHLGYAYQWFALALALVLLSLAATIKLSSGDKVNQE